MDYSVLSQKQLQLLNEYHADSMKKLKKICDPIILRKGIPQMYHDDLYDDAARVLEESIEKFNEDKSKFETYLTGNIKRSFYDWTRDNMRGKRCNLKRDKDGKIQKDENGKPIPISNVSFDAPTEDGVDLSEKISAGQNVEDIIFTDEIGISTDGRAEEFLGKLGKTQREVLKLLMQDYSPTEVREKLDITERDYNDVMNQIRENKHISIFNKKYQSIRKKEINVMEKNNVFEVMEMDVTDSYRMDKRSLISLLDDKTCGELDCNYISQREPFQWSKFQVNKYFTRILNNQPIPEIIICEVLEDGSKVYYLIDGLQRLSYAEMFRENRIKIGEDGAEFTKIQYRKYEYDKKGDKILDERGRARYTIDTFDVIGKKYKDLPEYLQKRFDNFNINVTTFFNCTHEMVDYHIRNYNNHEGMTKSQYGITNVNNFTSSHIKGLSENHDFFKDCVKCGLSGRKKGALEEVVTRTIMSMYFVDNWKREIRDAMLFVNDNADESHYNGLNALLDRLYNAGAKSVKNLFTNANSHIWISVFNRFTTLGIDDTRFIEFMQKFSDSMDEIKEHKLDDNYHDGFIDDITYGKYTCKNSRDKYTIIGKVDALYQLMLKYFNIDNTVDNYVPAEASDAGQGINEDNKKFIDEFCDTDLMYSASADMSKEDIESVAKTTLDMIGNDEDALLFADSANQWLLDIKDRNIAFSKNVLPAVIMLVKHFYDIERSDDEGTAVLEKYLNSGNIANTVEQNYEYMLSFAA